MWIDLPRLFEKTDVRFQLPDGKKVWWTATKEFINPYKGRSENLGEGSIMYAPAHGHSQQREGVLFRPNHCLITKFKDSAETKWRISPNRDHDEDEETFQYSHVPPKSSRCPRLNPTQMGNGSRKYISGPTGMGCGISKVCHLTASTSTDTVRHTCQWTPPLLIQLT